MSNNTEESTPARKRNWRSIGIFISTVAIIILLGIMLTISYRAIAINIELAHLIHANQTEISQLKTNINDLQTTEQMVRNQSNILSEKLNDLQKNVDEVSQSEHSKKEQLTREEANYYIKLAQFNLIYRTNIPMSIHLLELADQTFVNLTGTDVTAIRSALAKDIANLQSTPIVDVDGIYARLSAMYGEIKQLRLINQSTTPEEKFKTPIKSSWWQQGLQNTWSNLKQLIIIRQNKQNQLPILPNLRDVLYQNLNACVTNAIWALLQGEQDIYLGSLNQMGDDLDQYFMADDLITKALQTQIIRLKEMPIRQSAPTLSVIALIDNTR
jgi:uroporphyrin-III C-methyltransferase